MAGRRSKFHEEIRYRVERDGHEVEETVTVSEAILRAIRIGVPQKYAAQGAGVDEHTLKRWLARGREWMDEPEKAPAAERDYAHFAHEVVRAKGQAVSYAVGLLRREMTKGGSSGVRAIIEWLRTQAADEFKPRIAVEGDGSRTPAPIDPDNIEQHRSAFASAFAGELPELSPEDFAPPEEEPAE